MTREEITRHAEALETCSPAEILGWAAGRFAPRLTFATSLGLEDCVIVDLAARLSLPIDMFTLDTGLLFPETYELWRRIQDRYGIVIRGVRPEHTVDEQAVREGPDPARPDARARQRAGRRLGRPLRPHQDQSARALDLR